MGRPLYDQLANYYEVLEGRDWRHEVDLIASILKEHQCRSVIDLGCGTGLHVRELSKLGFDATGIDLAPQMIRVARRLSKADGSRTTFVRGSYYDYQPKHSFDAALCLNWSIPVRIPEVRRFLSNCHSLLTTGGLLVFDYEKISDLVREDVGRPVTESWDLESKVIVRVSVGEMSSNVLTSRDVYIGYSKNTRPTSPDEVSRYATPAGKDPWIYSDCSSVRFFSASEIRGLAETTGFSLTSGFTLPRKNYRRSYAVLVKRLR